MDLHHLIDHATCFRSALESVPTLERPIGLQKFPHGSCGDATLLLGTYLIEKGYPPFDYMLGGRGNSMGEDWSSHAWLELDGLTVDITSDQFLDGPGRVIACRGSNWHAAFAGKRQHIADYRIYDRHTVATLGAAYRAVCSRLNRSIQV